MSQFLTLQALNAQNFESGLAEDGQVLTADGGGGGNDSQPGGSGGAGGSGVVIVLTEVESAGDLVSLTTTGTILDDPVRQAHLPFKPK